MLQLKAPVEPFEDGWMVSSPVWSSLVVSFILLKVFETSLAVLC
jgi:hypothetical protein